MTVLSGRAGCGARSLLRILFGGVFALLGLIAGGCGSNTINYGTVVTTVSSDRAPFTAYIVDLYSFYLVLDNGNTNYGFTGSLGTGKTIDFTKLADTTELLGALAVPEGTYTTATITFNYGSGTSNLLAAQLFVDVGGTATSATLADPYNSGNTPVSTTYTIKFDPAHPLVVKKGTPTKLDFHFDMNASSIDTSAATPKVTVRPFMSASTQPVITKPLRVRGEFVAADLGNSNFTINSRAFFDPPSFTTTAQGAVEIVTNGQTKYTVNGTSYLGAEGLAAISGLTQYAMVAAYGSLTDTSGQKPIFTATDIYAGISIEDTLATRAIGTVVSRSGNTLHLHNTELVHPPGSLTCGGVGNSTSANVIEFQSDVPLTVDNTTLVTVDGQPQTPATIQSISIGQQVDVEGSYSCDSNNIGTLAAAGGLIRLTLTPAWGNLSSATATTATVNLLSLGDTEPAVTTFTGTGAATGADADPTAYVINTGGVDLSGVTGSPLLRFDGIVTPFGAAAPAAGVPDFTASAVTAGATNIQGLPATPQLPVGEQVLSIEWTGGTASPFNGISATGFVVNIGSSSLGTVQSGPRFLDLKAAAVSPTIVPDSNLTGQFAIGSPQSTTNISVYQSFTDYATYVTGFVNGTNTMLKLVAVGQYDENSQVFTAYRIDIVQPP